MLVNMLLSGCGCTAPVNLSNDPGADRPYLDTWNHPTERSTKNIAVCDSTVHVAWFNTDLWSHYGRIYYRRSTDGGTTWEPKVTITGPRDLWRELWVACTGDTVMIIYEVNSGGGNVDIRYRVSEDGGATWGPEQIPITSSTSYNQEAPSVALDGSNVHLVWADNRPLLLFPIYNIYYKRSGNLGSTWTSDALQDLSDSPIIVQDPSNPTILHLWFMTYNTTERRAKYRRSTNGGISWSSTVDMSGYNAGGPTPYDRPIGSLDALSNVVLYTWVDERYGNKEVILRRSADGGTTWSSPINLSGTPTKSWAPFVKEAPTGEARVYWMDSLDGDWEVVCKVSTDWGVTWSSMQRLTDNSAHDGAVSVAYDGAYWHVIWSSDSTGNYEVYYTKDPCPVGGGEDLGVSEKRGAHVEDVDVGRGYVLFRRAGPYKVFSADGRVVASGEAERGYMLRLRPGVWFVLFGGRTYRVVVVR